MGFEAFTYHGGALEVARRLAPDAPTPWIDLSTGINPHAYPLPDLAPEAWTRLPDRAALAGLEAAAAARYRASAASVVAGPGSQALIHALARLCAAHGESCALAPTYGGYAEAFAAAGVACSSTRPRSTPWRPRRRDRRQSQQSGRADRQRADLLALHARLARRGGMLIVDEAFADFGGADETLEPALPASGAVVLRSFGKTYGLAGLRLGFAIASPDIAGRLRAALGPWPVSGPAIAIGSRALADSDWLDATPRASPRTERGSTPYWSGRAGASSAERVCFPSPRATDASEAFKRLLAAGILTRPFAGRPDRLRFGVPAGEEALATARGWRSEGQSLRLSRSRGPHCGESVPCFRPAAAHKRRACPFARPASSRFPPASPFLPTLSRALLDGALIEGFPGAGGPLALADATIYVPTQRAAQRWPRRCSRRAARGASSCRASLRSALSSRTSRRPSPQAGRTRPRVPAPPAAVGALTRRHVLARLSRAWGQALRGAIRAVDAMGGSSSIPPSRRWSLRRRPKPMRSPATLPR